jgi:hypothetical protein
VTALLELINGATPETYGLEILIVSGTGLTVTGGEVTSNGWVIGSNTPPVVGGVISGTQLIGAATSTLATNEQGTLSVSGAISQPLLPIGAPVVIKVVLLDIGGVAVLNALAFTSLSVLELP